MQFVAAPRLAAITAWLAASLVASAALAQNYGPAQVVVPPSNFKGVHGLAVDNQGRLLAGSVVGMSITQVDVKTGKGSILVGAPQGQADDCFCNSSLTVQGTGPGPFGWTLPPISTKQDACLC